MSPEAEERIVKAVERMCERIEVRWERALQDAEKDRQRAEMVASASDASTPMWPNSAERIKGLVETIATAADYEEYYAAFDALVAEFAPTTEGTADAAL